MLTLNQTMIPERLLRLPQPPKQLFITGDLDELLQRPCVAIVGSRKVTPYGKYVTEKLSRELASRDIVIISGLAFGVDSIAHRAAIDAGGLTIAVLPSPTNDIHPVSHRTLAHQIVETGGALVSEYPDASPIRVTNFVVRNRIIAGLADATVIPEASLKSGSLHTARFALELGKDVLAVPGNINSPMSVGTNNLIRMGATPLTGVDDVLHALKLDDVSQKKIVTGATPAEQAIIDLLASGVDDGATLQTQSGLAIDIFNQSLTMLEITGKIRSLGANQWSL